MPQKLPSSPKSSCFASMSLRSFCFAVTLYPSLAFVLDVGAPRSGTQSMFEALKLLGLNSLWSGYYTSLRMPWCDYLLRSHVDAPFQMIRGFDGAMDEPFHLIYPEVLQAMPDAKFIYTETDPDRWYESYSKFFDSIGSRHQGGNLKPQLIKEPFNRMVGLQLEEDPTHDILAAQWECGGVHPWGCRFEDLDARPD